MRATRPILNKPHLLTAGMALGLCLMLAATAAAEPIGPRVKTAHESFDFGVVPQYSRVSHVFWLHNTGDQELVIDKLIPNCGCTEAPLEKTRAKPGDSLRVELIFGTGRFQGEVTKFTQIVSNSTGRAPALIIKANVVADTDAVSPVILTPASVNLDENRAEPSGDGYQYTVAVKNTGKAAVTLNLVDQPDREITFDFDTPMVIAPGATQDLTVRFASTLPGQIFSRSITFETSSESQPRLTLPIFKTIPWEDIGDSGS